MENLKSTGLEERIFHLGHWNTYTEGEIHYVIEQALSTSISCGFEMNTSSGKDMALKEDAIKAVLADPEVKRGLAEYIVDAVVADPEFRKRVVEKLINESTQETIEQLFFSFLGVKTDGGQI